MKRTIRPGEVIEVNGRLVGVCYACRRLVRERRFFGLLHFCDPAEDDEA